MNQHLRHLQLSNILSTHKDNKKRLNTQIQLLHQQYENDLIVLQQLVQNTQQLGFTHQAVLLAEKQIQQAKLDNNSTYLGLGHLWSCQILLSQNNIKLAQTHLNTAKAIFYKQNNKVHLSTVASVQALIALYEHNYAKIKTALMRAIELTKQDSAPMRELDYTIMMMSMARKFNQTSDSQYYLTAAENILDSQNSAKEQYARIYFQQGLLEEQNNKAKQAERFYRRVISIAKTKQVAWHKERAQYHLSTLLIRQNRHEEAIAIFAERADLSNKERVILASIHQAMGQIKESIKYAKSAYKEASLQGELSTALDAALILTELSTHNKSINKKLYISFIKKESVPFWLNHHQTRLKTLELYEQLASIKLSH